MYRKAESLKSYQAALKPMDAEGLFLSQRYVYQRLEKEDADNNLREFTEKSRYKASPFKEKQEKIFLLFNPLHFRER